MVKKRIKEGGLTESGKKRKNKRRERIMGAYLLWELLLLPLLGWQGGCGGPGLSTQISVLLTRAWYLVWRGPAKG